MGWFGIARTRAGCRSVTAADNGPSVQRDGPVPHTLYRTGRTGPGRTDTGVRIRAYGYGRTDTGVRIRPRCPGEKLRRTEYESARTQFEKRRSARTGNPAAR
ncbi:hypothetical protein ABZS74_14140, partial [Streptomyces microflavus]